jgi:hypothetical protein
VLDLNVVDLQNVLALFERVSVNGLREAEGVTVLATKIRLRIQALQAPPVTEDDPQPSKD